MMARARGFGFSVLPPAKAGLTIKKANKQVIAAKTTQYVSFLPANINSTPMDSDYNNLNMRLKNSIEI